MPFITQACRRRDVFFLLSFVHFAYDRRSANVDSDQKCEMSWHGVSPFEAMSVVFASSNQDRRCKRILRFKGLSDVVYYQRDKDKAVKMSWSNSDWNSNRHKWNKFETPVWTEVFWLQPKVFKWCQWISSLIAERSVAKKKHFYSLLLLLSCSS